MSFHEDALTILNNSPSLTLRNVFITPQKALDIIQNAQVLELQDFCTGNPIPAAQDILWECVFAMESPELYKLFLEVEKAYSISEYTKFPLSSKRGQRKPMFWRDCWTSLRSLSFEQIKTLNVCISNDNVQESTFPLFEILCDSHWTLAAVIANMDLMNVHQRMIAMMVCRAPDLLESVFFYEKVLKETSLVEIARFEYFTDEGVAFCAHTPFIYNQEVAHCLVQTGPPGIEKALSSFLDICHVEDAATLLTREAIRRKNKEITLMLIRHKNINIHGILKTHGSKLYILQEAISWGELEVIDALVLALGPRLFKHLSGYIHCISISIIEKHVQVFKYLLSALCALNPSWMVEEVHLNNIWLWIIKMEPSIRSQFLSIFLQKDIRPDRLNSMVMSCVVSGDVESLSYILSSTPVLLNIPFILSQASKEGRINILRLLLEYLISKERLEVSFFNNSLLIAFRQNKLKIATLLLDTLSTYLDHEFCINKLNSWQIITIIAEAGSIEAMRLIIQYIAIFDIKKIINIILSPNIYRNKEMFILFVTNVEIFENLRYRSDLLQELLCKWPKRLGLDLFKSFLTIEDKLAKTAALFASISRQRLDILQALLDDGQGDPTSNNCKHLVDMIRINPCCLPIILTNKQVKAALPRSEETFRLLKLNSLELSQVLEELLVNMRNGLLSVPKDLPRMELKELVRRCGHPLHAAMDEETLLQLLE